MHKAHMNLGQNHFKSVFILVITCEPHPKHFMIVLQLEDLRVSERNLRARVRSLTNEVNLLKRYDMLCYTTHA